MHSLLQSILAALFGAFLAVGLPSCVDPQQSLPARPWVPDSWPWAVRVSADMPDPQFSAIVAGVAQLNRAAGQDVFRVVGGEAQPDDVQVTYRADEGIELGVTQLHFYGPPTVWLRDTANSWAVAHELLHCLGMPHSADPDDIMFPYLDPSEKISAVDVAWVHARLAGDEMPYVDYAADPLAPKMAAE